MGFTCARNGDVVTVNPLVRLTVSVGSKTVTVRGPAGKLLAMLMTAVKLVGEFTVTEFTVMPPKLTEVLPCTK